MSYSRTALTFMVGTALTACTLMQTEAPNTDEQLIEQPKPEFPQSELRRSREGWVVIAYTVNKDGIVIDPVIEESSGSDAFNKAALQVVRDWRYELGQERELSALLNFVYDRKVVQLSREFVNRNNKAHEFIDRDDLEAAQATIDKIRSDDNLTAVELAYSYLTEGRIAGERGDRAGQLQYFRRAMLNDGRWLARENYLQCLRAAVILEIELEDFVSAFRDYELLTETGVGRKMAADLGEAIQALRAEDENDGDSALPYMAAKSIVSVLRERPATRNLGRQPLSADRGSTPPPKPPPKEQ